jgi:hypothetical protein
VRAAPVCALVGELYANALMLLRSWIDGENWQFPVRFSVYDEDVGRDDFIGGASFSSLPFLTTTKRQEVILTLQVFVLCLGCVCCRVSSLVVPLRRLAKPLLAKSGLVFR